ncbi:unnamed protein product [Discula destructiva]
MSSNVLSSVTAQLQRLTQSLPPSLRLNLNPQTTLAVVITALSISIPSLSYAVSSYRGYLALGRGGMPYNVFGWLFQGLLQLVAKGNTRDPSLFSKPRNRKSYEPHGSKTFFANPIPERAGNRPTVPGYVAPQRQTTQQPADLEVMSKRMRAYLDSFVIANTGVLISKPSNLEGVGTPAVFLDVSSRAADMPGFMRGLKGETAHIHPECSSHVTLSMADAEEVVRKGWAERHRLSGVGPMPWSYMLIYAPRDDEEFEVWKRIMKAGLTFVCTGAGRELVVEGDE